MLLEVPFCLPNMENLDTEPSEPPFGRGLLRASNKIPQLSALISQQGHNFAIHVTKYKRARSLPGRLGGGGACGTLPAAKKYFTSSY